MLGLNRILAGYPALCEEPHTVYPVGNKILLLFYYFHYIKFIHYPASRISDRILIVIYGRIPDKKGPMSGAYLVVIRNQTRGGYRGGAGGLLPPPPWASAPASNCHIANSNWTPGRSGYPHNESCIPDIRSETYYTWLPIDPIDDAPPF